MLAIVRQNAISILTQARLGPRHHKHSAINGIGLRPNTDSSSRRKTLQRNGFDGPPADLMMEAAVMNHLPISRIYSVMRITFAFADEMSAEIDRASILRRRDDPIDIESVHGEPPAS